MGKGGSSNQIPCGKGVSFSKLGLLICNYSGGTQGQRNRGIRLSVDQTLVEL